MNQKRYLEPYVIQDLKEKMVFLGGPRQVGKTTMAKRIGAAFYKHPLYLNWDSREDQALIHRQEFDLEADLIIFDELHKYAPWKNYIKGLYDKRHDDFHMLITGSARLDIYRRGGDSLFGRYHYLRLHPFSVAEILGRKPIFKIGAVPEFPDRSNQGRDAFEALFAFGGFPEPFLKQNLRLMRRWKNDRIERLIKEDIRDIEAVRHLSGLQLLTHMLPPRAASVFSLNSIREDLNVSHNTAAAWMEILERFYYHFRLPPFASNSVRSLRKEPKLYLWDWSEVEEKGPRLENMVALHLLKFVHFLYDVEGYRAALYYLRDTAGRETDFLVTVDQKPWFAAEVKWTGASLEKSLRYFGKRLRIPYLFQVVHGPGVDFMKEGARVISADKFLSGLV